jgi:hypothetical protein
VELDIAPQPSDEERAAIAAALDEDADEELSAWAKGALPDRDSPGEA